MRIYSIYKITNNTNSKSYVGKTNKEVEKRFNEHLKSSEKGSKFILHSAIRKYGPDNFSIEILFQSTSDLISEKEFTTVYEPLLIDQHKSYHKEYGYNMTRGGEGFDSETAKDTARKLVENGTHALLRRPDGTSHAKDKIEKGTHHFLKRSNGTSITSDKVGNGTHPFLRKADGSSISSNKVKNGTHQWMTRPDGSSVSSDKVKNGTHQWLQNKGLVTCYNKVGVYKRIPKEEYNSQSGPMEDWEWVFITSKEGKRRKNKIK